MKPATSIATAVPDDLDELPDDVLDKVAALILRADPGTDPAPRKEATRAS